MTARPKARIFLELDHIREINRLLIHQPDPTALPEDGNVIKEFSAELEPDARVVIHVVFSKKGSWIRPVLYKNGKLVLELDPYLGFIDREYHFCSGPNQPDTFDYRVEILAGRYSHQEKRFVPIGKRNYTEQSPKTPEEQYRLAEAYAQGVGVERDYFVAKEWYIRATNGPVSWVRIYAQLSIGVIYEKGLGVNQDFEEARKWYMGAYKDCRISEEDFSLLVIEALKRIEGK